MLKAMLHGRRDLRLDEVPTPAPGPGEVLVRIEHASLCASDIDRYEGNGFTGVPRGLGHDAGGVVEAVGDGVGTVRPGDAVTLSTWVACGRCRRCSGGHNHACLRPSTLSPLHEGWFAQYTIVPEPNAIPLLPGVTTEDGGLMETVYTGWEGARVMGYGPGELVPIFGAGWMAWGQIAAATAAGARVVVIAGNPGRLRMARHFGAIADLRANDPDLHGKIRELNGGEAPLYVIDATGGHDQGALPGIQQLTARGGIIGLMARKDGVPLVDFARKNQQIRMIGSGSDKAIGVQAVAEKLVDMKVCVSHRFPFERLPEAFALLADDQGTVTKILIDV